MGWNPPSLVWPRGRQRCSGPARSRLDEISFDGLLTEGFQGFEPVETLHKNKPITIGPIQNRGCLAFLQNALGSCFLQERVPGLGRAG